MKLTYPNNQKLFDTAFDKHIREKYSDEEFSGKLSENSETINIRIQFPKEVDKRLSDLKVKDKYIKNIKKEFERMLKDLNNQKNWLDFMLKGPLFDWEESEEGFDFWKKITFNYKT